MLAEIVERRQAVLSRLLALRADGRLSTASVRLAAESLQVSDRSVWRWLRAATYSPATPDHWTVDDQVLEALYVSGGRPVIAWRLLRDQDVKVPSVSVFTRALQRDVSKAELAYAREGENGRRRYSIYRRWDPADRNDVWETDHAQLDISVIPAHGQRLVKPWLTVLIDGYSRVLMGWALSLQPTTAEVLVAIREAVLIDHDRGPWGGVPDLIRFDGGREFLSKAVANAAAQLGCAALPTVPYSPHKKGKVERLHQTIGQGLIAQLPHFAGGPRQANGQLYAQGEPLSLAQLQTQLREFIDQYNRDQPHSALAGQTPQQKWESSERPLRTLSAELLRSMLLADERRQVAKDGIHFHNQIFIAPELAGLVGESVQIRYMPHDDRSVEVFGSSGWLCTAVPQTALSAEATAALIKERQHLAKEMGRRKAAATRKAKLRIAPITANGSIQELPPSAGAILGDGTAPSSAHVERTLRLLGSAPQINTVLSDLDEQRRA